MLSSPVALTHLLPFPRTTPVLPPGVTGRHPGQFDGGAASAQRDPPQAQRVHAGGSGRLPPTVDAVRAHTYTQTSTNPTASTASTSNTTNNTATTTPIPVLHCATFCLQAWRLQDEMRSRPQLEKQEAEKKRKTEGRTRTGDPDVFGPCWSAE